MGGQNLIFQVNKEKFILYDLKYDRGLHVFSSMNFSNVLTSNDSMIEFLTHGLYLSNCFAQALNSLGQLDLMVPQSPQVLSFLRFQ